MSFSTGYRGTIGGAVQTSYTDQPGVGVPGMLAFASDINLTDAVYIGELDGIAAGLGVMYGLPVENVADLQVPSVTALLPITGKTAADFRGIVVFDERMNSDSDGFPGWANGRVGRVVRNDRSGGRIYVKCPEDVVLGLPVFWQLVADATHQPGEFRTDAAPIPADTVEIPNAKWITGCVVPAAVIGEPAPYGIAMIELLG